MRNAGALQRVGERYAANLTVGQMRAVQQRIDHRVLEVRAPPPGHQARWLTLPALGLEIRPYGCGEPRLHVNDGAVEVEHAQLHRRSQLFERPHCASIDVHAPCCSLSRHDSPCSLATSWKPSRARSIV